MGVMDKDPPIRVDGVKFPEPTEFRIRRFNLTKAGRVASGEMKMEFIAHKRRFEFAYRVLSAADLDSILTVLTNPKLFFTLEYVETDGSVDTATVYVGELPQKRFRSHGGRYWTEVQFNLIEK